MLKIERKEIKCSSNMDICYFEYLLNKTINKKKNIILNGGILAVKG